MSGEAGGTQPVIAGVVTIGQSPRDDVLGEVEVVPLLQRAADHVVAKGARVVAWHSHLVVLDCIGFSRATGETVRRIVRAPVLLAAMVQDCRLPWLAPRGQ
jgi:hypothetical protein